MSSVSYVPELFCDHEVRSFSRIPLVLATPKCGQTWNITWHVADQAIVSRKTLLVEAKADTGDCRKQFSALVPGRIHIRMPSQRYVPEQSVIGELEYGLAFEHFLSESREDISVLRARSKTLEKVIASLEKEIIALDAKRADIDQENQTFSAQTEAYLQNGRDGVHPLGDYFRALFFLFHQNKVPVLERLSLPVQVHLLYLAVRLQEHLMSTGQLPPLPELSPDEQHIRHLAAIEQLYDWKSTSCQHHPSSLDPEIEEEKLELWDRLRDRHLHILQHPDTDSGGSS